MSWLGVKYALALRDERVKGGARLVLVALAARVNHRHLTTSPTSLSELRWLTFLSAEQIRRIINDLEEWKLVRRLSRGKHARYALPGMAGPLFAIDDGDPVKMTDFVIEGLPKEIGHNARKVTGRMPGFRRRMTDFSGRRAGGVLFSSEVPSTEDHDDNHHPHTKTFDLWWVENFPRYNDGAQSIGLDPLAAYGIIDELLATRTLERLQLMAIVLWRIDAREHKWIPTTDRGLKVLRQTADWLDRYVGKLPAWWRCCPHVPKCSESRECQAQQAAS